MKNKIKQLEEELHEQCVLNGKGSEREANLLGKVERLERENAALREVLNLTVDRLMFYMECIPMAHKDYIKTLEGKISYEIVNKSLILLKKEAQP